MLRRIKRAIWLLRYSPTTRAKTHYYVNIMLIGGLALGVAFLENSYTKLFLLAITLPTLVDACNKQKLETQSNKK